MQLQSFSQFKPNLPASQLLSQFSPPKLIEQSVQLPGATHLPCTHEGQCAMKN